MSFRDLIKLATSKPPMGELGSSGNIHSYKTAPFGSGVAESPEYKPTLKGNLLYDEVDKMRLGDSQIKGALKAIKLPLLSADWNFEPANEDAQQQQIADWLTNQLHGMSTNWKYVLHHILLSLDYGTMPFETVYEVTDDPMLNRPAVQLRKLAPRMPRTITQWVVDDHGGLAGITQYPQGSVADFREIHIPVDKLLVFIHEQEGSNYRGTSILRSTHKDWYYKDRLQKMGAIAIEKRGSGIDVAKLKGASPSEQEQIEQLLMTLRVHERSYIVENDNFDYRVEGLGGASGGVIDALPWVQYYDWQILHGLIAEFLGLGSDGTGSLAMSKDKSTFFLMALRGIAQDVVEVFNRHLVPKLVNWNWPNVTEYPKLTHSRLDRRDAVAVVEALAKLIPVGGITVDADLENEVRNLLELPELEVETAASSQLVNRLTARKHPVQSSATRRVNWVKLEGELNSAERRIIEAYAKVQQRQIDAVVKVASKAIRSGDAEALDSITIPYKQQAADSINDILADLYKVGQAEAMEELRASGAVSGVINFADPLDPTNDEGILKFLGVRALTMASVLSSRLRGSLMRNGLNMIRRGQTDPDDLRRTLTSLSDSAIRTEAGLTVSEALNLGRQSAAERNAELIRSVEYSALLDGGTCSDCNSVDGTKFPYSDKDKLETLRTPYSQCQGRGRCRCVLVYTTEGEA